MGPQNQNLRELRIPVLLGQRVAGDTAMTKQANRLRELYREAPKGNVFWDAKTKRYVLAKNQKGVDLGEVFGGRQRYTAVTDPKKIRLSTAGGARPTLAKAFQNQAGSRALRREYDMLAERGSGLTLGDLTSRQRRVARKVLGAMPDDMPIRRLGAGFESQVFRVPKNYGALQGLTSAGAISRPQWDMENVLKLTSNRSLLRKEYLNLVRDLPADLTGRVTDVEHLKDLGMLGYLQRSARPGARGGGLGPASGDPMNLVQQYRMAKKMLDKGYIGMDMRGLRADQYGLIGKTPILLDPGAAAPMNAPRMKYMATTGLLLKKPVHEQLVDRLTTLKRKQTGDPKAVSTAAQALSGFAKQKGYKAPGIISDILTRPYHRPESLKSALTSGKTLAGLAIPALGIAGGIYGVSRLYNRRKNRPDAGVAVASAGTATKPDKPAESKKKDEVKAA